MKDKPIACFDLGTQLGWCIGRGGKVTISGTRSLITERLSGAGMRYVLFQNMLDEMQELYGPIGVVYFEEVRKHKGTTAAHIYGGLISTLMKWCEDNEIPYMSVPVQTIKKHISGKGNASKDEVIDNVKSLGHKPRDDNEADAIALYYTVINQSVLSSM